MEENGTLCLLRKTQEVRAFQGDVCGRSRVWAASAKINCKFYSHNYTYRVEYLYFTDIRIMLKIV